MALCLCKAMIEEFGCSYSKVPACARARVGDAGPLGTQPLPFGRCSLWVWAADPRPSGDARSTTRRAFRAQLNRHFQGFTGVRSMCAADVPSRTPALRDPTSRRPAYRSPRIAGSRGPMTGSHSTISVSAITPLGVKASFSMNSATWALSSARKSSSAPGGSSPPGRSVVSARPSITTGEERGKLCERSGLSGFILRRNRQDRARRELERRPPEAAEGVKGSG